MRLKTASYLVLLLTAVLWSAGGAFLKSLPDTHWAMIAGVRSLFAAVVFLPGLRHQRPPGRKLAPVVLLYAAVVTTLMGSMQLGTAAQGIWLQYTAPAVVAVWVWRRQGQRPRPAEGLALGLTGVAIGLIVAGGRGPAHYYSLGLGLASGVVYGLLIVALKDLAAVSAPPIHVWTNLGTTVMVVPIALMLGVPLPTTARELGLLAAMGVFQLALPYYLFQWAIGQTRALEASLILLLEPVLNPIWAYLAAGDTPSATVIAGCSLIACGLVAFTLAPLMSRFGSEEE
jgi:drug/metabolite transporter (DMT)-like permease